MGALERKNVHTLGGDVKKILITGGAGVIGQEIARQLDTTEWEILLYDDFSNRFTPTEGFVGRNLWPHLSIHSALEIERPDVISHHAAAVGVGESMYNPLKYVQQNCLFTADLIQAIIDTRWKGRILHASSMGIFGEQLRPADEGEFKVPKSFYGLTKAFQEDALFMLWANYPGIELGCLRYFSVYSSTFNPENPLTGILSVIVDQILQGGPVELYDDGGQTRDMIHVRDVAKIHNAMVVRKKVPTVLNVCTGRVLTMRQIVDMVATEFGYRGEIKFNGKLRAGDIHYSQGINTRLKILVPVDFIPLEQGIREYREFIKANRDKIKAGNVRLENQNIAARGLVR